MAIPRPLLAISLLLLSLVAIASANYDYNSDSYKNQAYNYDTKPDSYKPSEEVEKPNFSTKPEESSYGEERPYAPKPNYEEEKPGHYDTEDLPIAVQGLVLCKSGPKYYPIQGALARITCLAVDEKGYEKTHSVCSGETDAKGYFYATLMSSLIGHDDYKLRLIECRAFLESSPVENCNVPVDVNKGISGAPLSDYHVLNHKRIRLYSVGPFFFTSQPNYAPNDGY
ncbi:Pollen Ole e 1 allergen/extensin [Corchorus olitorius]|uniref:Pollen Ole e 1 allergen/extensin n=1 Tax=Corchorus olitorius TaxID=93759 RepID=A0A1R3IHG0_9ROSI|nr:Pollen Ole e 1 allergen/extensin [Corchorus olitorius]